jgi:hypothetical protein
MRGSDARSGSLFSYVDLEKRVPAKHPLRVIKSIVDEVQRLEPPAQVMRTHTGFHADEAGRQVGESGFELPPGELKAQDDGADLVEADEVESVLADVDAKDGDGLIGLARHGGTPCYRLPPFDAGYCGQHRRSIPLGDLRWCSASAPRGVASLAYCVGRKLAPASSWERAQAIVCE